jgi:thiamine-phosphate diphosphorylase
MFLIAAISILLAVAVFFHIIRADDPSDRNDGPGEVRKIIGRNMILGKTTHNLDQGRQAIREGADYISVGPVYPTPTKPGRPAVGLEYVREAAHHLDIPFVAIGGVDLSTIDDVLGAGAKTVAVVRAFHQTAELLRRVKERA